MTPKAIPSVRRRAIAIAAVLTCSALMQEVAGIIGTSGVVADAGIDPLLGLWVLDAIIAVVCALGLGLIIDRSPRRRLAIGLLGVFGMAYIATWGMRLAGVSPATSYGVLYSINSVESRLVPLTVWALARDMMSDEEAITWFGPINSISYAGSFIGGAFATWAGLAHVAPDPLMAVGGVCLLLAAVMLRRVRALRHVSLADPDPTPEDPSEPQHHTDSPLSYLLHSPLLRGVSLLLLTNGIAETAVAHHVIQSMSGSAKEMADLQAPYGEYRLMICLVAATAGSVLPAYLVRRLGFQRVFVVTPISLLMALAAVAIWPGEIVAICVSIFLVVAGAVESPAVSAYLVRTPAHLRGRVAALVEGSTYSVGYVVGALMILFLHRELPLGLFGGELSTAELILLLAAGASALALVGMRISLRYAEPQAA